MKIRILATGSTGNCYIIDDEQTSLMIECGIPIKQIFTKAGGPIPRHCLVTHEHGDHAKSAKDLAKHGVTICASAGTLAAIKVDGYVLHHKKPIDIGSFTVTPLNSVHDAEEPLMFYILSGNEKILFVTDTCRIPYRFRPITHLMIEVNHDETLIEQNVILGRILQNHLSLQDALEFISGLDPAILQAIYLIHPSQYNLDIELAKRQIREVSGVPVFTL